MKQLNQKVQLLKSAVAKKTEKVSEPPKKKPKVKVFGNDKMPDKNGEFSCNYCDKKMTTRYNINRHEKNVHKKQYEKDNPPKNSEDEEDSAEQSAEDTPTVKSNTVKSNTVKPKTEKSKKVIWPKNCKKEDGSLKWTNENIETFDENLIINNEKDLPEAFRGGPKTFVNFIVKLSMAEEGKERNYVCTNGRDFNCKRFKEGREWTDDKRGLWLKAILEMPIVKKYMLLEIKRNPNSEWVGWVDGTETDDMWIQIIKDFKRTLFCEFTNC